MKLLLLICIVFLLISCGNNFAGTGQHGEAKIVGIVMTSHGTPAANSAITVSDVNYRSRTAVTEPLDTVLTDENGYFEFESVPGRIVTIAGQMDSTLLYLTDIQVEEYQKDLGTVSYVPGQKVTIHPWWESDGEDDRFIVEGTDWYFDISDNQSTDIYLPRDEIILIHFDIDSTVEFILDSDTLTDLGTPKEASLRISVPETVSIFEEFELLISEDTDSTEYYSINWGDSTGNDIVYDTAAIHSYFDSGVYEIEVSKLEFIKDQEEPIVKVSEITTIVVREVIDSQIVTDTL